ncbi:MAG: galactose oxidase [Bacteroidetes bacterium]|nr:galactose oxidase [Bacteroidota bacterium]
MKRNFTLLYVSSMLLLLFACDPTMMSTDFPQDGNWIHRSVLTGVARNEATSFVIGDNAYICTGYSAQSNTRLTDCWEYNVKADQWTQKSNFPGGGRSSAIGFNIGEKGYIGTGNDGSQLLKDFWEYDPSTNIWTRRADFSGTARQDAIAFGILDKGYIATGDDGINSLKDLWEYNPSTNAWTRKSDLKGTQRSAAVSFVYQNKAYVVTGKNADTAVSDFWFFDPSTSDNDSWKQLRSISNSSNETFDDGYTNILRSNAVAFVMAGTATGDKAYISTGESNGTYYAFTWEYDFATDLWREKTPFEESATSGAVGFSVDNRGFIATGSTGSGPLQQKDFLLEFHPDEVVNSTD